MEEISIYEITDYQTMKQAIGNQLNRVADGFCKVGYLFKRARDESDMLKDSGYSDVNSFALAEFGLDKTQVSRFIRINDRFSIGGYSEHLEEKYEGFGVAKLSLMLTLPDEINEELSPEYTKSEINTIKTEYEAEQKITEMEVMMEELADGPDEFIAMIVKEMNDEHPEAATYLNTTLKMAEKLGIDVNDEDIKEAYIPEGVSSYNIRISGQGRFMVSMKEEGITIINTRDPANKTPLSWPEFKDALLEDMKVRDFPEEKESEKKPVKKPEKRSNPQKSRMKLHRYNRRGSRKRIQRLFPQRQRLFLQRQRLFLPDNVWTMFHKMFQKSKKIFKKPKRRKAQGQQASKNLKKSHNRKMKGMQLRKLRRQQAWRRSLRTQKMF